jgi:hypothetical protein
MIFVEFEKSAKPVRMPLDEAELRNSYGRRRWAVVPHFIDPHDLAGLVEEVLSAPAKRVTVGDKAQWWTEHTVAQTSALGRRFTSGCLAEMAARVAGVPLQGKPRMWAQSYQTGEWIPWHRDSAGDIQLMVCLALPPRACGGLFLLREGEAVVEPALRPGDAVLFEAARLSHSTTPLVTTSAEPAPRRVTAVARFFAETASA